MPLVTMRKARITLGTLWLMTALGGAASAQDPLARQRSLVERMGLEMPAPAAPAGAPHRTPAPFVREPRVAMPGPNILVNDPTGESCGGGCTQSGESIAVSGSSVVIGFNDSKGTFDGTNNVSGYAYSTDGGMSFIDGGVLPSAGTGDVLLGNPALVFCNGSFYYASLYRTGSGSTTPGVSAVSVSKGALSGPTLTWSAPVVAALASPPNPPNSGDILAREYVACDASSGALYVSYTRFSFRSFPFFEISRGQIELVQSTDGGVTWSSPPTVIEREDPTSLNHGAVPAVGPNGEVYVAWAQGLLGTSPTGKPTIQVRTSLDGGASFPRKTQAAEFFETSSRPPKGFNPGFSSSAIEAFLDLPSIAVDRSAGAHRGNIYIVFQEADRDIRDIKLARSTTGGSSFESPVRVNDDPPGSDQFFPWITVDPTDGQISVISYDRRRDPANILSDVFLAESNDGGVTFTPGVRLTDTASGFFVSADRAPNFGDYINATADGAAIYATWADGRRGDPDVFFSRRAKDTGPSVFLKSFSIDDSRPGGDGDGILEPGESPRINLTLANAGVAAATDVSATLTTASDGVVIAQGSSGFADLPGPGSTAAALTPYQLSIDASQICSRTVVCPPIRTQLYGVDPGGTIVRFAFDTGESASVPAPEQPTGFANGLAVASATDAFFAGTQIFEFNPQTGAPIAGAFPVPPPGIPNCTDGLAIVAPTRLFTENFCESTIYEIDMRTGATVASHFVPAGLFLFGGLAGGNGRLFASTAPTGFGSIASIVELDPDSGKVLNAFPAPGFSFPFSISGLAFDGTNLFAASGFVRALDAATGSLLAVSPFRPPSQQLSALGAVAEPAGTVCVPGTSFSVLDFDLAINTDQGTFSSSFSIPLGNERTTTVFLDDVEHGGNGWTATGEWHQTTDRSASPTHAWYFGAEHGPGTRDNAYGNNSAGDLTSPVFDLSSATTAELVFDHYLDAELNFDLATVSASRDGFATSTPLRGSPLAPARDAAFTEVRLDLSAFAGSPAVQVRFTFESDHDLVFEGWYVDNIRVEQTFLDCAIEPMTRPSCRKDADCDDGAPCTMDRCSSGQCVHLAIGGFVGADCKLGEALSRSLCGPERIDPGLQSFVTKKLTRARDLLQKAERNAKARQSSRLIGRADRSLLAISRRASRAARTRRISATCRVLIGQRIRELRQAVAGLRR